MPQLAAVANGQLSDASQLNQYRTLFRGGYVFDVVNGYGADNTGVADCSTAINQAISDANGVGGGTVFFPEGTYLCASTLTLYSKILIKGAGPTATIIKLANAANVSLFMSSGFAGLTGGVTSGGISEWGMMDITLEGNAPNNTTAPDLVRIYGFEYLVQNVFVRNPRANGWYSEWGIGNDLAGNSTQYNAMETTFINYKCNGSVTGWGLKWWGPHDAGFFGCIAGNNHVGGFWIGGNGGSSVFTQCHAYSSTQIAWRFDVACYLSNCQGEGGNTAQALINHNDVAIVGGQWFGVGGNTSPVGFVIGGQVVANPTVAPTLGQTTGGSLTLLGTYTIGYSWLSGVGETLIGPTANITLTGANNAITITVPAPPAGVHNIKAYVTAGPAGMTGFANPTGAVNPNTLTTTLADPGDGLGVPASNTTAAFAPVGTMIMVKMGGCLAGGIAWNNDGGNGIYIIANFQASGVFTRGTMSTSNVTFINSGIGGAYAVPPTVDWTARYFITSDGSAGQISAGAGNLYVHPASAATQVMMDLGGVTVSGTLGLTMGAGILFKPDTGTVTGAALAATLSKQSGAVTTESLSTAAAGVAVYVITNTLVTTTSKIFASVETLTNTTIPVYVTQVKPAAGSFAVSIRNAHASAALNGTLKIHFLVIP